MRKLNRLTEKQCKNLKPDPGNFVGRAYDGGGLLLQATLSKAEGINRNWVFRYELDHVRHDLGLGPLHTVSLAEARKRATALRLQILDGIDPAQERIDQKVERLARKAEQLKAMTFQQCAEAYFKVHNGTWSNDKHRKQWVSTMRDYVYPIIGKLNVADIDTGHIQKVLEPIWKKIPETASRTQKRIEHVMSFAIASKFTRYKAGDNPARRELLVSILGKIEKNVEHHPALPFADAPAFMADLRKRESVSARALEFTILTAVRTGETIGALWSEIDLKGRTWTIPAARMKMDKEHRVPLSDRAVEILKSLPGRKGHLFINGGGRPLSNMAMLELLRGMSPGHTVHGFRATFRTWAGETTAFAHDILEASLAHIRGDMSQQAYDRGDLFVKRGRLMKAWAEFLSKPHPVSTVHNLKARRA